MFDGNFCKSWNEIALFRGSGTSLFTWLLSNARQAAFEFLAQETEKNPGTHNFVSGYDQHYSGFELVYIKELSVLQAAELISITGLN